jgi:hypothetical protein
MPKQSKGTRISKASKSLKEMLEILEPYAPKGRGTLVPGSAEWRLSDEEERIEPATHNLKHASEPAA